MKKIKFFFDTDKVGLIISDGFKALVIYYGFVNTEIFKDVKDAMYPPMGLAVGPDGSLYISESKKGKIWKV